MVSAIAKLKSQKVQARMASQPYFIKLTADNWQPVLTQLFNAIEESGETTASMQMPSITVLLKPGKDPTLCSSYRPITLLNTDANLFATILANRLGPYLPGLIEPNQVRFIQNREGADNFRRLAHLIEKSHHHKIPA